MDVRAPEITDLGHAQGLSVELYGVMRDKPPPYNIDIIDITMIIHNIIIQVSSKYRTREAYVEIIGGPMPLPLPPVLLLLLHGDV